MFDLNYLQKNFKKVQAKLALRPNFNKEEFAKLPKLISNKRKVQAEIDNLRAKKNTLTAQIPELKKQDKDISLVLAESKECGEKIATLTQNFEVVSKELEDLILDLPNIPDSEVTFGKDENENTVIKTYLEPKKFDFHPKDHVALNERLGLFDFERAGKVAGARFVYDIGLGARLERALISFMLDLHSKRGYIECIPPYLVSKDSMYATGKFPKFMSEAYHLEGTELYLNPTAEIPMIDMYRNEILDFGLLPLKYCAYSTAFRPEAGAAGKDTKGLIRQHQFHKVELISFTKPEESKKELKKMLKEAELVLQKLGLPYRVVRLCSGDLGHSMSLTYDIEVWLPGQNKYREISSVSTANDYQARRANIRFKRTKDAKTEFVHTLNGSGVAVGRCAIAIIENYQHADGTILIPKALQKYMGVKEIKPIK